MVRAYILIEVAAGHSRELVNTLRGQERTRDVDRVTGPYDVILELEATDVDALSQAVSSKIHSATGVVRTITCVCLG